MKTGKFLFTPFPKLETMRVFLRKLKASDYREIFHLRSNEAVNHFISRPNQKNPNEARGFITRINDGIHQNKWIYWAITLKPDPTVIGTICLWNFSVDKHTAEVGFELNPTFQKRGIMTEALGKVMDFGFNSIKLKTIEAYTHKNNIRSTKLLITNGFKLELERTDPENLNNIIFSCTHPETSK